MTLLSTRMARWTLMAAAAAAMIGLSSPVALAAASPGAVKTVSYLGYGFQVPAGWPVIHTGRRSTTCVNFDRHAIYLGDPGRDQSCPSGLLGTTEAILVQPLSSSGSSGSSGSSAAEDPVARRITVVGPRVEVTATYDTDRALVARVLASAGLPVPGASAAANGLAGIVTSPNHGRVSNAAQQVLAPAAAAATVPTGAVSYLGQGFDACA